MRLIDEQIIKEFDTISLEEMGKVRLMNRIDTKFVTDIEKINTLLRIASKDYLIQEIDGQCNMPYYTKYFDTPDVNMFYQHQRGKKNRQKVRMRVYEGSDTPPFIEIKTKNNKGRTRKDRIAMDKGTELNLYNEFLNSHLEYDPDTLRAHIENHFYRITLVNRDLTERVTIDTELQFHNLTNDSRIVFSNLGIIEWKRDGRNCRSDLDNILKDLRIHPGGFSKYCIGMAVTTPDLRQNRLKKRLRRVNKIEPFM